MFVNYVFFYENIKVTYINNNFSYKVILLRVIFNNKTVKKRFCIHLRPDEAFTFYNC